MAPRPPITYPVITVSPNAGSGGSGGGTKEVDYIVSTIGETTATVTLTTGSNATLTLADLDEGTTFLHIGGVPAEVVSWNGTEIVERPGLSGDGFYTSRGGTTNNARGIIANVIEGYGTIVGTTPIDYDVVAAQIADYISAHPVSFSYTFTVTDEDQFSGGFKLTHNQPEPGMIAVSLYDLGVIGSGDKVFVQVYDRTRNIVLTDWGPFAPWANGVFYGSASTGDQLTINVTGPWSTN